MPTYHTKHIDPTGRKSIREVEGRKFKVAIGGGEFWFFVHDAYDAPGTVRISDVRSGLRVIDVPHIYLSAARGDKTIAAKSLIKDWLKDRNQANVCRVIQSAPSLHEGVAT